MLQSDLDRICAPGVAGLEAKLVLQHPRGAGQWVSHTGHCSWVCCCPAHVLGWYRHKYETKAARKTGVQGSLFLLSGVTVGNFNTSPGWKGARQHSEVRQSPFGLLTSFLISVSVSRGKKKILSPVGQHGVNRLECRPRPTCHVSFCSEKPKLQCWGSLAVCPQAPAVPKPSTGTCSSSLSLAVSGERKPRIT